MTAATLQELSNGRFLLGVAAGAADFLEWVGIAQEKPLGRMRETLQVLRRLLSGENAEIDGAELQFSADSYLRFDAQMPRVPLYLGANGPKMLELAGQLADGALPLLFPPEHYYGVRPLIAKGEERRNPELGSLDIAACVWISVGEAESARRALAEKVAYYGHSLSPLIFERLGLARDDFNDLFDLATRGGRLAEAAKLVSPQMLRIGIAGGADEVIERLLPLVASGVSHLSFGPPLGPEPARAIELLGRRVLPALRRAELA